MYHLILSELFAPLIVLHVRSNLTLLQDHAILANLDFFEILITQKLLNCPKDPFVRSALIYITLYMLDLFQYQQGVKQFGS